MRPREQAELFLLRPGKQPPSRNAHEVGDNMISNLLFDMFKGRIIGPSKKNDGSMMAILVLLEARGGLLVLSRFHFLSVLHLYLKLALVQSMINFINSFTKSERT